MGFMHLKIKVKKVCQTKQNSLRKKFNNQFYTNYAELFQLPNAIERFIHPLALEIYHLALETFFHFAFKENAKTHKDCLLMIDN